jgi:hypothetical protein
MYGKPAITCFKYQVVLYGLKAITYLNIYFEWLQSQQYESPNCPHPPLQAAPHFVWQHYLHPFERELLYG